MTAMTTPQVSLGFQTNKRPADYARLAAAAEALDFDGVSAFHDFGFQPSLFPLLEMARATTHIRLGPACLNPFLLHPVEIAGQVAALDLASHGRAYCGLTRGAWLGQVGIRRRPLAAIAEAIEVIRRLLAGDDSGTTGTYFPLDAGTRLAYERERDEIDILLGTWGPRGLALAGQAADEVKLGGCANPDMVAHARGAIEAASGGRHVGLVAGAVTVVDRDRSRARARARREVAMYLDVVAPLDKTVTVPDEVLNPLRRAVAADDNAAAGKLIPDEILDKFAFSGTPEDVAAQAIRLIDAGASRIEFGTPHGRTDDDGITHLGKQALPLIREHTC